MHNVDPRFMAHQRRRFMRSDAYRYVRRGEPSFQSDIEATWASGARRTEEEQRPPGSQSLRELAKLHCDLAQLKCSLKAIMLALAAGKDIAARKFSPDQPRIPAGEPGGGRWTDGSNAGGTQYAQNDTSGSTSKYRVDIAEEDRNGGHIGDHIARTDDELLATALDRVPVSARYAASLLAGKAVAYGTFASVGDASYFVNETLNQNRDKVDRVIAGDYGDDNIMVMTRFGYSTGREVILPPPFGGTYRFRPTYAVRIILRRDTRSENGYRVQTAFPINE
jgi:hypothetical protein